MQMLVRYLGRVAAVGLIIAAVAACGSSSGSSTSSDPSGGPSATTAGHGGSTSSKGTIKIALVSDFTGQLAPSTGVKGAEAYFAQVNAAGGLDGHKLEVTKYDSGSSAATALQAFRRAVAAHPAAILEAAAGAEGSSLSTVTGSGLPVVDDGFAPGWIDKPTLFSPVGDVSTHLSTVWLTVDKKFGNATKIAVVGSGLEKGDLDLLSKGGPAAGVDVVMSDTSLPETLTSPEALSLAQRIKGSGADGVVVIGTLAINQLQADLNQLGAHVAVVDPVFEPVGSFGSHINGELFAEDWANPYVKHNAGITSYLAAMKAVGYGSDAYTDSFAPFRYAQAEMLVERGLTPAGPPFAPKSVIKALASVKNYTANGILSKVSFPQYQHVGIHCLSVMKVVDGAWVPQTNGSYPFACGGPSQPTPGT